MTDAVVKVNVDTTEGVKNLKKLKSAAAEAKQELSSFDKIVNSAFGTKNIFHVTNFNRALNSAIDTLKTMSLVLIGANTAIVTFFAAIVKELNKLQGFLSIMTLSSKSVSEAEKQFTFLRTTANRLGIDLNVLTSNYAKLVAAIPEGNEKFAIAQRLFTGLAMAARTLHASTLDTQLMFYAVTQMASKGVISMEELRRQLGERLPGAMEIAARALQTTTTELEKAIRTGSVQSAPFLKYFGDELIRTFAESADIAANTVDAALNRLKNVWVDFVKVILDSGAGNAIIQIFDALREKLSDPYVMGVFASMLGDVANKVADFIKSLTAEDVLNAFTALKSGIKLVVDVTLELIRAMTWFINNSKTVGAVLGGLFGAAKGASIGALFGGPVGAGIGAAIGGAAGAGAGLYAGSKIQPTDAQDYSFQQMQQRAALETAEIQRQSAIMLQSVMGSLGKLGFSGENMASMLPLIEKRMGFNVDTAQAFASLIYDKQFKNLQERQAAALSLTSTGYVLGPRGTLAETLGGAGGDKDKKAKREPRMPKTDDLKEGLQYIEMLQRMLAKEEQLTEVEKLWRAVAEGRVAFNSADNFLRAKGIALKIDEANATQMLAKAETSLNKEYQDQVDKLQDLTTMSLMSESDRQKTVSLREYDQKVLETLAKITIPEVRTEAEKLAAVMRDRLIVALDEAIMKTTSFMFGLQKAFQEYFDSATNAAKIAEDAFGVVTRNMEDMFLQLLQTGTFSMRQLVGNILIELARIGIKNSIAQLFQMIGGFGGGGGGGNGMAEFFRIDQRALGGPVSGNKPYLVGEQGPELFVPSTSGKVLPNSGSGGVQYNQTVYIDSRTDRAEIAAMLDENRLVTIGQLRDMLDRRGF